MQILITCRYLVWSLQVKKIYSYSIGYVGDFNKIKPLCIMLLKRSAFVKGFDCGKKWAYFLILNDLLKI